ncbi:hypothetical protein CRG98_043785, partial [Punica granatum]
MMMIGRNGGKLAAAGQRLFTTAALRGVSSGAAPLKTPWLLAGPARTVTVSWVRAPPIGLRNGSTLALGDRAEQPHRCDEKAASGAGSAGAGGEEKGIVSYWGVSPAKVAKEDGTEWKWHCFRPWETYEVDLSIDLKKHHAPLTFLDRLAFWTVKAMRYPTDIFFQRRYGCRAMMLETVAAVPGM